MPSRRRTSIVLIALCAVALCCGVVAVAQAGARNGPREAALLRSLADWSGWSPERLDGLRAASGEDDIEDFAVAMVVALDLGVSARTLIEAGRRDGLVAALRGMGISGETARREVRRAEQLVRGWRRQPPAAEPAGASPVAPPGSPSEG